MNLTSLDLHYLIKELQFLLGGKIDSIYHPTKKEILLQFHVPSKGKYVLRIIAGKNMFLTEKTAAKEPTGFCMFLRKHLGNARLRELKQINFERIVEFVFEKKEKNSLVIELFSKGNIILCKDGVVVSPLEKQKWSSRVIRPKEKYVYPKMKYNFLEIKKNDLKELVEKSDKENLVKCLAVDLGLGGVYAEELCFLARVDKNKKKLNDAELNKLFDAVKKIRSEKIKANISSSNVLPFELQTIKPEKTFETFNQALNSYFLEEKPKERTDVEKEMDRIDEMIRQQEEHIKGMEISTEENKKKAEFIYKNYKLINEILTEMKKAREKHSWKEIKKRLEGHKMIKDIDEVKSRVMIEVE